jgi:hypothetical protein
MSRISGCTLTGDFPGTSMFLQNGNTLTKMYWLLGRKSQLSTRNKLLLYKIILKPTKPTLGYGFHFQQRNPRTLPIESFAHDSGCTLVHAKYGYPKGSPITNPPLQLSIQCSHQRISKWHNSEPRGATRQQVTVKTPAKWSAYQTPSVVVILSSNCKV